MDGAGVKPVIEEDTKLEIVCRTTERKRYYFIINLAGEDLVLPQYFAGKTDILTGNLLSSQTVMACYDVALVCEKI